MSAARKQTVRRPLSPLTSKEVTLLQAELAAVRKTGRRLCAALLLIKSEVDQWSMTIPRSAEGYRMAITQAVNDALAESDCEKDKK